MPAYLRYEGQVRLGQGTGRGHHLDMTQVKNMNLDSTMTAEMIADILRAKEECGDPNIKMADFLYNFICLKYTTTTLQMEFSYNLVDGIDRFKVGSENMKDIKTSNYH